MIKNNIRESGKKRLLMAMDFKIIQMVVGVYFIIFKKAIGFN